MVHGSCEKHPHYCVNGKCQDTFSRQEYPECVCHSYWAGNRCSEFDVNLFASNLISEMNDEMMASMSSNSGHISEIKNSLKMIEANQGGESLTMFLGMTYGFVVTIFTVAATIVFYERYHKWNYNKTPQQLTIAPKLGSSMTHGRRDDTTHSAVHNLQAATASAVVGSSKAPLIRKAATLGATPSANIDIKVEDFSPRKLSAISDETSNLLSGQFKTSQPTSIMNSRILNFNHSRQSSGLESMNLVVAPELPYTMVGIPKSQNTLVTSPINSRRNSIIRKTEHEILSKKVSKSCDNLNC